MKFIYVFSLAVTSSFLAQQAFAQATTCRLVLETMAAGSIAAMSDSDVEKTTCIVSQAAVDAISRSDEKVQRTCIAATRLMIREFERRFPARDPGSVAGTCS